MRRKVLTALALALCLAAGVPGTGCAAATKVADLKPEVIGGGEEELQSGEIGGSEEAELQLGETGGSEDLIRPCYRNTAHISAGLRIKGSTAWVNADVTAKKTYHICVTMRLQRKVSGKWRNVRSWIRYSDNGVLDMTESYNLTKHSSYRTYAIFEVAGEKLTLSSSTYKY